MDRTAELRSLCASLPRAGPDAERVASAAPAPGYVRGYASACGEVGAGTKRARSSLGRLGDLVRTASIFADPAEEIALLVGATGEALAAALAALRSAGAAHLAAPRAASRKAGGDPPLAFAHCASIEAALTADIDALSRDFKAIVRDRAAFVERSAARRGLFGKNKRAEERTARARVPVYDDAPRARAAPAATGAGAGYAGLPRPPGTAVAGDGGPPRSREQAQALLIPDDTYLEARADASAQIESQVAEVSSIFGKVAQMIKDQNESVERIEINVEAATADVESAQDALLTKLKNMSSNTATALKVGGIVCATLVAYILII